VACRGVEAMGCSRGVAILFLERVETIEFRCASGVIQSLLERVST